jgi:integrase
MSKFPKPFYRPSRGLWYVQLGGRQVNLGSDKDQAHAHYHQLMARRGTTSATIPTVSSNPEIASTPCLVLELIDSFLGWCQKNKAERTYEWYVMKTSSFARSLPRTLTLDQLKPFHVHDWVDAHPRWAPGMKRSCMTAVQRVFNWAVKQGRITFNPVRHLEKPLPGRRDVLITQAEFAVLLNHVPPGDFRDLLTTCWETGCRPQEIVRLEARHVDLANQRWVFPPEESKGKRQHRVVYLTPEALEITQRRLQAVATGPVFRNRQGRPWCRQALACAFARVQIEYGRSVIVNKRLVVPDAEIEALQADLRARGKDRRRGKPLSDAELRGVARSRLANQLARKHGPKYCLYHLRHSWATRALERGVDAVTVAVLMGHTDTRMLMRVYQHLSQNPTHLTNAMNVVNQNASK